MTELIRKAQNGDKEALSQLINSNSRINLEYCEKISS